MISVALALLAVGLGVATLGRYGRPLQGAYTIESYRGPRTSPITGLPSYHHGIDLGVPVGTPVYSVSSGVARTFYSNSGGYVVEIEEDSGKRWLYMHLSVQYVRSGDAVRRGEQIGLSGNTGSSTGPHLHFELRLPNGESDDPKNHGVRL